MTNAPGFTGPVLTLVFSSGQNLSGKRHNDPQSQKMEQIFSQESIILCCFGDFLFEC